MRVPVRPELFLALVSLILTRVAPPLPFLGLRISSVSALLALQCTALHGKTGVYLCSGVSDAARISGEDGCVGHSEPVLLCYLTWPGSGNQRRSVWTLLKDRLSVSTIDRISGFQLPPALCFDLAMCAPFSKQVSSSQPACQVQCAVHSAVAFLARCPGTLIIPPHGTAHSQGIDLQESITRLCASTAASAARSLDQVTFVLTGSERPTVPDDFSPIESTSPEQRCITRAARSSTVTLSVLPGYFDFCAHIKLGTMGDEGSSGDGVPADGDEVGRFPTDASLLAQVAGRIATRPDFSGAHSQGNARPNRKNGLHSMPISFTRPPIGPGDLKCSRVALKTDLPGIEQHTCNRSTGAGCPQIPVTADGAPAAFGSFFHIASSHRGLQMGSRDKAAARLHHRWERAVWKPAHPDLHRCRRAIGSAHQRFQVHLALSSQQAGEEWNQGACRR